MSRLRRDSHYLSDIQEAIRHVLEYTQGSSYEDFLEYRMVQDAVLWNFQVIGEATKGLSETLRSENPRVPWRSMAGLRDRIVHAYFGIDLRIVWDVIRQDLPLLLPKIVAIKESG